MRYKICNAIISVFVKDYEDLKKYSNGRSLPLQEQIENEAKNSEDGCAYLQMIIPRKQNKNSFNKNENYTEYESESEREVTQSCPTLCDPVDCSPPGSSVHGILQARILEWVAISFSRGSS